MLMERYHKAIDELFAKVRETQTENISKAADMIIEAVTNGKKVRIHGICHSMEMDSINRGGGLVFYRKYQPDEIETMQEGDVLIVSSVSGRTKSVVDLAWNAIQKGIKVIAFISMAYATQVDPVHESGQKLYEFVSLVLDNCAPVAEGMLPVEGLEAPFAAASGMASNYIMWSMSSLIVERMIAMGSTPGVYKTRKAWYMMADAQIPSAS